jgi:hypothetical protein
MIEFKDLMVEEGLFHREFVIRGDQDYIELCDNLLVKYKEMETDLKSIRKDYKRLQIYLSSIETNGGYSINNQRLVGGWSKEKYLEGVRKLNAANNKMILLKKKEHLLKNYYKRILIKKEESISIEKDNQRLKNKNKYLRQKLNFLQLKNRNLRIKLILSKNKT